MATSQEEDLYDEETNQSSSCRDHSTGDILPTRACLQAWVVSTPHARKWILGPFPRGKTREETLAYVSLLLNTNPAVIKLEATRC